MAKFREYDIEAMEEVYDLGKALASPVRLEMLQLLYDKSLIIGEIAKKMNLPASSAAFHAKILEKAGLIRMEEQPGTRGTTKLCTRKVDYLHVGLVRKKAVVTEIVSIEMPVGAFTGCKVKPTCGLWSLNGVVGNEDMEQCFYYPEKSKAGILWTSAGYVEYKFPNEVPKKKTPQKICFSAEICSEAPGYREDWKSDITVWINEKECGTWTSPGDFGAKRGRLNSSIWPDGSSQYGLWTTWEVDKNGCYVNGEKVANRTIDELDLMSNVFVKVRIGNKNDATYVGGFNLFGKDWGDYRQDLVMTIES